MPDRNELDELLQSALSTYADPGPDSDLAGRVFARVAAANIQRPSRLWWRWAIALPACACLMTLLILYGSRPTHAPSGNAKQALTHQPPPKAAASARPTDISRWAALHGVEASRMQPSLHRRIVEARTAPKLNVFPTPQPLTPAERALAAYAAHAPEAEREALVAAQSQIDQPLAIAEIKIQPLEPPEPGGN